MNIYERYILPPFINLACGTAVFREKRAQIVRQAQGVVLDVGAGSGHNFPYFDSARVSKVWALEPSVGMRKLATKRQQQLTIPMEWLDLPGEKIPLPDKSIDTVVLTFTLCTIPDWHTALQQMHRVLKPEGRLLFCEHGLAPDVAVQQWQQRITPLWKKCAGGCHLDRPIVDLLRTSGFTLQQVDSEYLTDVPRIAGYVSCGMATI